MSDNDTDAPLTDAERAYIAGVLGAWGEERSAPSSPLSMENISMTLMHLDNLRRAAGVNVDGKRQS